MKSVKQMIMSVLVLISGLAGFAAQAGADTTKCYIWLNLPCSSAKLPLRTSFEDNWLGASNNATVCLQRAKQYYDACGSTIPNFVAYSTFSVNGLAVISASSTKTSNAVYSPTSNGRANYGVIDIGN